MSVFPHPGGPNSSIPRTWLMPICLMMCDGQMRDPNARRKILLNSASKPPIPSFSKSKSDTKRLEGEPPAPSARLSPMRVIPVVPSAREKLTMVGDRSWPSLADLVSPSPFRLATPHSLTVSSYLDPSKSMAMLRPGVMTCSSRRRRTVSARRVVSISLGLALGSAFFLERVPTVSSSSARAMLDFGTKGAMETCALKASFRYLRCRPFSAT
mmetsp:Transcript_21395/g.59518  ORF Transcript_21395/g.59518 Transcript_21395/m.59518 type:complete len:212 (-) Transcript_21395:41-676(-)